MCILWELPKNQVYPFRVPRIRTIIFGVYIGVPLFWETTMYDWVAVKELKLSYYIGETLLLTIYTHYGNFI